VSALADGSPTRSFYRPRIRPGTNDAIVSMHDGSKWRLAIFDVATKSIRALDFADGASRYDGAWLSETKVVAVAERGGVANLETFDVAELRPTTLTSVTGAAVAPEPQPRTTNVWFLSLYSRGYDLRRVDAATARVTTEVSLSPSLTPAAPLAPRSLPAFGTNEVSAPRPFGLTPRLFRWIPQPYVDADGGAGGITLSSRDLIGRSELTATGAYGAVATWRGGNVSAAWHRLLPTIRIQAFAAGQRLSDSRSPIVNELTVSDSAFRRLDTRLAGGMVSVDGSYAVEKWSAR
jgi:hypothetical protein